MPIKNQTEVSRLKLIDDRVSASLKKQSEMTDAKVPDNKSDWKSIDIYLFSNGQQSSPPRKYHLVVDQLDWWKATLNHLAKAQYGPLQSIIELYTIDGKKVETPMQLSHNTAYVAVAPPDYFVHAGYEKYLIKATRSWEKGQTRRASNTAVVKPEEPEKGEKSNSDINEYGPTNIKDIRDGSVTLKTIVASMVDNQTSVIVKPEATTDKHINNTNKLNPIKQPNRTSVQRPAIVKNIKSLTSPPRTRKPSLKRRDSVKIITEKTSDRPSISESNRKVPSKNKIYKPIQKKLDSLPEAVLAKVEEVLNEIKSSSSLKLVNHSMILNDKTAEPEIVEQDKEAILVPNLYKNAFSEKPSIAVNPDIPSSFLSNHVNRQGAAHELFNENHKFYGINYDKIENEVDSHTAISLISKLNAYMPLDEKSLFSPPISSTVAKPENNVAVINKEGIVNMKLNIEIWNGLHEAKPTLKTASKKESLIILKPEKGSQVDIEAGHDKLQHTILANEIDGNEESHKVLIVKYVCINDGGEDNTNHIFPINNENSKFLIFLPVLKLDERCKRCECKKEHKGSDSLCHDNLNVTEHNNLKKTTSYQSILSEKTEKIASHLEAFSRNHSTEIKVEENTLHDKNEISLVKRKSVAIREDEIIFPETLKPKKPVKGLEEPGNVLVVPHEPDRSELIVLKKESTGILHKTVNKFTQTEWCDVLWEARLQNDGHYSFHIPTLEMLKYYKL